MSFRGFDEDDDEAFDELNFPVQETSLTQVSDRSSSQMIALVESESFRSTTTTQILKRAAHPELELTPDSPPLKPLKRKVDFFPQSPSSPILEGNGKIQRDTDFSEAFHSPPSRKRRRIPGPAGEISFGASETPEPRAGNRLRHPVYRHLQGQSTSGDNDVFFRPPWLRFLQTFDLPPFQDLDKVELLDYSVKYVVQYGYHKRVPQLFVIVKDVNTTDVETTITFRDPTGEIGGTIHRSVTEKWGPDIKVGAVLCLKTVTVFNPTPFAHFLNVTAETVVDVIPPDCKPPPIDEKASARLKKMNPCCIYKRRPELETDDPRFLHRLAQRQMRTLQQRRDASLSAGVSFHSAAPSPKTTPSTPSTDSQGRGRGRSRGRGRGRAGGTPKTNSTPDQSRPPVQRMIHTPNSQRSLTDPVCPSNPQQSVPMSNLSTTKPSHSISKTKNPALQRNISTGQPASSRASQSTPQSTPFRPQPTKNLPSMNPQIPKTPSRINTTPRTPQPLISQQQKSPQKPLANPLHSNQPTQNSTPIRPHPTPLAPQTNYQTPPPNPFQKYQSRLVQQPTESHPKEQPPPPSKVNPPAKLNTPKLKTNPHSFGFGQEDEDEMDSLFATMDDETFASLSQHL